MISKTITNRFYAGELTGSRWYGFTSRFPHAGFAW